MGEKLNPQTIALPPALQSEVAKAQDAWRVDKKAERLWRKDATLWTGGDEGDWLGWLHVIDDELHDLEALRDFARGVRAEGFADVLLLGIDRKSVV